jgi:hypothetical protein
MKFPPGDRAALWARRGAWLLLLALLGGYYVFVVSAGHPSGTWWSYTTYYDFQAEGFRAGHLHLSVEPSPALLAMPNPADPIHGKSWLWDASLHDRHYYLYWGPVPALLLAAFKIIFRSKQAIGDQNLVLVFIGLQLPLGAWLITRLARRLYPKVRSWAVVLAVVVFGLANPTPWLLARGAIYEAAIASGQLFLLGGVASAFQAIWWARQGRPAHRWLLAAGAAWALALGCRLSLAPAIALLALAAALAVMRFARSGVGGLARGLGWVGGPLALVLVALGAYNHARFGGWLETGVGNQLSTMKLRTSIHYLWPNIWSYLFRPITATCKFPFALSLWRLNNAFPAWFKLPAGYWKSEPVAGLLASTPWCYLMPVAIWGVARRPGTPDGHARLWLTVMFALIAVLPLAPALGMFIASMRYLGDVRAGIVLLGTVGAFTWLERSAERPWLRRLGAVVCVGLAGVTLFCGLAFGFVGYFDHFQTRNPALWQDLQTLGCAKK